MRLVMPFIFAVIGVFAYISISSTIQPIAENADGTYSGAVSGLAGVMPIIFAVVIIFSVFNAFCRSSDEKTVEIKLIKNEKSLILTIKRASDKLNQYINNLDDLLGIQTIADSEYEEEYGLKLENKNLYICGNDRLWDWYIADKHPFKDIFKIVGLHKKDKEKNLLYILGRENEEDNAYLIPVSNEYIADADIKQCIEFASIRKENREKLTV